MRKGTIFFNPLSGVNVPRELLRDVNLTQDPAWRGEKNALYRAEFPCDTRVSPEDGRNTGGSVKSDANVSGLAALSALSALLLNTITELFDCCTSFQLKTVHTGGHYMISDINTVCISSARFIF